VVAVSGSRALERYAWLGGTSYALDSVGDVFASFFMLGTGLLVFETRVLPRWLGWIAVATSPFFLLQGFGLGGLVSSFGLILDPDRIPALPDLHPGEQRHWVDARYARYFLRMSMTR
jgi:hypothetical protein